MTQYQYKYVAKNKKSTTDHYCGRGAYVNPQRWCYADPEIRDQYYGWLKHKAQAKYRHEPHSLTVANWFELWSNGKWSQRGRLRHSLCLTQCEPGVGWHMANCEVVPRIQYLQVKRAAR